VFLFFVLSGFLITGILLDSKEKPHYWRNFYIRRALRILPILVLVLVVVKVFYHATWLYIAICMAYMANLAQMFHLDGPKYGVLWSLAVEEQFYLGWPWLVRYFSRRHLGMAAAGLVLLSPLLRGLSTAGIVPLGDPHSMTWLISDNLAIGALLAIMLRSKWGSVQRVRRCAVWLLSSGVLLLFGCIPLGILHRESILGSAVQTVPFELIFAALLLFSLLEGERPAVMAWTRPLRFFGYISYGLYLYHELVFTFCDAGLRQLGFFQRWSAVDWVWRFVAEAALSVLVAYFSRRYFEAFFLGLKGRLTPSSGKFEVREG
jgi:peptidoglycan/LPS O-acetylase OafA/YrhL